MHINSVGRGFQRKALWLLLMIILGCQQSCAESGSGTLVIVELSGELTGLDSLQVTAILDGRPARSIEIFRGTQTRFGLQFDPGTSGPLKLLVEGLLANRCVSASGEGNTVLSGQAQIELGIIIAQVLPLTCGGQTQPTLAVTRIGDGSGTVTSMPNGISCGTSCSAMFQSGQRVTLGAQPDSGSVFAGWSGACTGTDPAQCQVTVIDLVTVRATFNKQPITSEPGWPQRFGSSNTTDTTGAYGVALDSSGNVVVVGSFFGTVDFGGGPLISAGSSDVFVAKYKPDGTHLWSKRYGGTGAEYANSVVLDSSGEVYVSGVLNGVSDLGGGMVSSAGLDDGFLARYRAADGSHVWSKRYGGTSSDGIEFVTSDGSGNLVMTGRFYDTVNFGGTTFASAGFNDIVVAKYKMADGSHVWSRQYGGSGLDAGIAVAVDSAGDIYVTGRFQNTVNFGGGPHTAVGMTSTFLARFKMDGTFVWSSPLGGPGYTFPYRVFVDNAGSVFLTGRFSVVADFGSGPLIPAGGYDGFVARYRSMDGSHFWSKRFGGTGDDDARGLAVDGGGNLVFSASFEGMVDLGGGPLTSAGSYDLLLARYKIADGSYVGARRLGGTKQDFFVGLAMDGSGNAFLTGTFQDTVDFAGKQLTAMGQSDAFVMKIAPP